MLRGQNAHLVNQKSDLTGLTDSKINHRPWYYFSSMSVMHKCLLIMAVCFASLMVVAIVGDNKEHIELPNVTSGFTEDG